MRSTKSPKQMPSTEASIVPIEVGLGTISYNAMSAAAIEVTNANIAPTSFPNAAAKTANSRYWKSSLPAWSAASRYCQQMFG
jgi:hypothetical protein